MKKVTLLVVALFASLGAFAQFNKGRMIVGGTAEFSTNTNKNRSGGTTVTNGTTTSLSISPNFGYFVIDNLAVGASLGLSLSKWNSKGSNGTDSNTTSINFGPFARYYLPFGLFFQGKFNLGTRKTTYDELFDDNKYNTSSFALSAGYPIFLSDNVALEPEVGYRTSRFKASDSNAKDIDSGIFMRIGFQIYLGKK
jgi:outer membrane protein